MISACVALALGAAGLAACGDDSAEVEPASQQEIQQDVNKALDANQKNKKSDNEAEESQQDVASALEDAQEQSEADAENPSY